MKTPGAPDRCEHPAQARPRSPSIFRPARRRRRSCEPVSPSFFELRAHHDEGHEAAAPRIGPAVPVAELHHDIARLHDALAVVQEQHALAFEKDAVIDGRRLVDGRAVGVLSAAVPGSARSLPRRVQRHRGRVPGGIVILRPSRRLDDAQMPAVFGRFEMKRQTAVVALPGDDRRAAVEYPDVRHAGARADRARIDVGRRAVEEHARAAVLVVSGDYAPNRPQLFRHAFWKSTYFVQSSFRPACFTIEAYRSFCRLRNSAYSSGVLPAGSRPSAMKRLLMSGSWRTFRVSAESRARNSFGIPAGDMKPIQPDIS